MNRKLRHTLSALSASGAALAIALMVAVPASPFAPQDLSMVQRTDDIGSLTKAVALSAEIAKASAMAVEAGQDMDAQTTPRAPHKGTRHRRQTIVMPYFSFSPRG
jgi:ethanolamine utilization protein EutP (predicted NTPase)